MKAGWTTRSPCCARREVSRDDGSLQAGIHACVPGGVGRVLDQRAVQVRRAVLPPDLAARKIIANAQAGLGERGKVWWKDGAPDLNRTLAKNSPYADWFAASDSKSQVASAA